MILFDGSIALVPSTRGTRRRARFRSPTRAFSPHGRPVRADLVVGHPLDAGRPAPDDTLNGNELALLRLVAQGAPTPQPPGNCVSRTAPPAA
ncbi:hypothetical protein NKH18_15645 [Streptomyces sp. M10(2022)]